MVRALCRCLNVKLHIRGELSTSLNFSSNELELNESQDVFFQQVLFIFILLYASLGEIKYFLFI